MVNFRLKEIKKMSGQNSKYFDMHNGFVQAINFAQFENNKVNFIAPPNNGNEIVCYIIYSTASIICTNLGQTVLGLLIFRVTNNEQKKILVFRKHTSYKAVVPYNLDYPS